MGRLLLALVLIVVCGTGCTFIEPGKVGIRVNSYGSQRGVEDYPIETGRIAYNPFTTTIYEFPTFMQQAVWSKNGDDGKDESVTFSTGQSANINADVMLAYQIKAERVPHIFVKFRQDAHYITHVYMRSKVRDALNKAASQMQTTDVMGLKKNQLLEVAKQHLKEELEPEGFLIDTLSFVSAFRVDPQVEASINATITATQRAVEAENKIKQSEAEAKQAEAVAQGKAQARLIEAKASAEANRLLTESLSPELLQYEALQKWDGKLPTYMGEGELPLLTVPVTKEVK